jgi:hypothetical protein
MSGGKLYGEVTAVLPGGKKKIQSAAARVVRSRPLTQAEFTWLLWQAPTPDSAEYFMATHTVGYDKQGKMVAVAHAFGVRSKK